MTAGKLQGLGGNHDNCCSTRTLGTAPADPWPQSEATAAWGEINECVSPTIVSPLFIISTCKRRDWSTRCLQRGRVVGQPDGALSHSRQLRYRLLLLTRSACCWLSSVTVCFYSCHRHALDDAADALVFKLTTVSRLTFSTPPSANPK